MTYPKVRCEFEGVILVLMPGDMPILAIEPLENGDATHSFEEFSQFLVRRHLARYITLDKAAL